MFQVKPLFTKAIFCVKICISLSSLAQRAIYFVITLPNWQIFVIIKNNIQLATFEKNRQLPASQNK